MAGGASAPSPGLGPGSRAQSRPRPLGALGQYCFVCSPCPPREVSAAVTATSRMRKLRHREARSRGSWAARQQTT